MNPQTTTRSNVISVQFPQHGMQVSPRPTLRRARQEGPVVRGRVDDRLIERIALGNLDAATELRERHVNRLTALAEMLVRDETEAARIVDFALERACSGWPPERGHVARWLTRLVRRGALARRRVLVGPDIAHVS